MKYFIVFIMLLLGTIGWSQSLQFLFRGKVENFDLAKKEGGVTVSIVQSGGTVSTATTSSNGKYTLKGNVDYSQPFDVVFSKSGFVSKKVGFDFSTLNEEDTPASAEFQPLEALDMSLFKERENVDFSFLDSEPVAEFNWNERKMEAKLDGTLAGRMRSKIEALLNEAENAEAQLEADYQAAIRAGDDAFGANEYEEALSSYEKALGYKPNEKYPADKILELDALIRAQKSEELAEQQENQEYYNLIEAADNLRDDGSLEKAVSTYKEASSKRPSEQYPKDQISSIQDQIDAKDKELADEKAYQAAIKSGDTFMKQNSLRPAKDKFEAASKLKPEESYPKEKLKEIEDQMAALEEQEAIKKNYTDAINAADIAYDAEDFQGAKDKYKEALTFESSSTYAKGRIVMCDEALNNSQAEEERLAKIKELLEKGNTDLTGLKYEDAVASFTEVLTLDDENVEATTKLAEAQSKLEELANDAEREKQYTALIQEGDQANTAKNLDEALSKYESAKVLNDTPEVNEKIAGVQEAINLAKSDADKEAKYTELIADAESKFGADDLQGAIDKYTEATALDPTKPEPAEKVTEIQKILDERAADQAKNDQFAALIKEGNDLMASNDLENAKAKFEEAATIDASSPEPKAKIKEIEELIAKNSADFEKQESLQAAIDAGDNFFDNAKWDDAQAKYREAIVIDPNNTYAKDRVSEIDFKIAEEKNREQVEALLGEAQSLRDDEKLEKARTKFQEVLSIDPSNTTASSQIDEINSELAALQNEEQKEQAFADLKAEGTQLFNNNKLVEAKQKLTEALSFKSDAGVEETIVEIDKLIALNEEQASQDEQYANFIEQAESSEASKDYAAAISSYESAGKVKPSEDLPKDKVEELSKVLAEIQANSSINEQYSNFITEAESFESNENYTAAISSYKKAGDVKPEEALPKSKVTELTALIEANLVKQAAIDKEYDQAMERGEELMKNENYLDAITAFNDALALKPTEKAPEERAAAAEEAERQKGDGDAQYDKILTVAESKIAAGNYDKAEELINRAKMFKPEDTRPEELLNQVNNLRARDKKYDDYMAAGESKAGKDKYKDAIAQFEKAKALKPSETVPMDRIDEMNRLLKDASSVNQKKALYKNYMDKGQAAMTGTKFVEALGHYQNALSVKSGDQVAQDKVNEIQQILDDIANANAEDLETKNEFNALIKKGNELFSQGRYLDAKVNFDAALGVDPYSSLAKERSDECARLAANVATEEAEEQYQKLLSIADKNFDEENWEKAKEYYDRAINIRKTDKYPKKKLKEIDAIQNPAIVQSMKLEPLGEEFNGTIEEGGFIVQSAEETRRLSKGIRIQKELDKANASQSEIALQNQEERLGTQNEMYAIWEKVAVSTEGADDSRQATIKELRDAEQLREESSIRELAYEKGENLTAQEQLNTIAEEVSLDYLQGDDRRKKSVDKIKGIQTSSEEESYRQGTAYIQRKYDADQVMNQISIDAEADVKNDYEERLEIDGKIDAAANETTAINKAIGKSKYDNIQREKAGIEVMQSKIISKTAEDTQIAKDNNEKVKDIRTDVNTVALAYMQQNDENSKEVNAEIAEVRRKVISDNDGFDKVRKEANDRLKNIQSEHATQEYIASEGQTEKYLANQQRITDEEEKRKDVTDKATSAMSDKIAYVERQDKAARSFSSQGELSDEEERLNARQKIVNQEISQSAKANEDVKSHEKSSESLKDIKRAGEAKIDAEGIVQRDKNLSAQQGLDKINDDPKKKVIIANSLGQEYPAGVSQESFTRKDEAGLVTTVITRRVVVVDGHADVYVRTQTKYGITYSKNNKPSLQHVWNKETQGPDLERHY